MDYAFIHSTFDVLIRNMNSLRRKEGKRPLMQPQISMVRKRVYECTPENPCEPHQRRPGEKSVT